MRPSLIQAHQSAARSRSPRSVRRVVASNAMAHPPKAKNINTLAGTREYMVGRKFSSIYNDMKGPPMTIAGPTYFSKR